MQEPLGNAKEQGLKRAVPRPRRLTTGPAKRELAVIIVSNVFFAKKHSARFCTPPRRACAT